MGDADLSAVRRSLWSAALGGVLLLGALAAFWAWHRGEPYGAPQVSPNGRFFVQKYSNLTWSRFIPGMPGHGSDGIDGYIRLYDRDGHLLHEWFQTFLRDVEPVWSGDRLYLMGMEDRRDLPYRLPRSAE